MQGGVFVCGVCCLKLQRPEEEKTFEVGCKYIKVLLAMDVECMVCTYSKVPKTHSIVKEFFDVFVLHL